MSEPISPNTTIAQYTVVPKLGEGGMGEAEPVKSYRNRDWFLQRLKVAL